MTPGLRVVVAAARAVAAIENDEAPGVAGVAAKAGLAPETLYGLIRDGKAPTDLGTSARVASSWLTRRGIHGVHKIESTYIPQVRPPAAVRRGRR